MGARTRTREPLHPATFGTVMLILVTVGRLPELVPHLGVLQLGNIAAALGLLGLLVGRRKDDVPVFQTSTGRLVLLFALVGTLSVPFAPWQAKSLEVFLSSLLTNTVMFFLIARSATSPRMLQVYTGAIAASAAMLATEAVTAYTQGRVQLDTAYDPNDLAMVLVTILPLVATGVIVQRGLRRWALTTVAILMLLTILLTGSRGGILGLIAVVGYLVFARFPRPGSGSRRAPQRITFGKVAVIAGGAMLVVVAMPQFTLERLATLTNLETDYNVAGDRGRLAVWGRGLDAFAERPWGYGLGNYPMIDMHHGGTYQAAHNIWLEVGVEMGLLGVVALFGLFWVAARTTSSLAQRAFAEIDAATGAMSPQARQLAALGVAARGSLIGYFVTSFFLSVVFTGVFWVLLGLVAAMERQEQALADEGGWRQAAQRSARRARGARGPAHGGAAFARTRARRRGRSWTP